MSDNKGVIESRGEDVEEAITAGLARLGAGRDEVDIEVLHEGSRGFLGLGSRQAAVRLTIKSTAGGRSPLAASDQSAIESAGQVFQETPPSAAIPSVNYEETAVPVAEEATEPEGPSEEEVALDIVQKLLTRLQVQAKTAVRLSDPDDMTGERLPIVDINGRDLGVLIGPQGATLNAIQYISRLMAGHVLHRRANFIIDVESYRERRKEALARLAERMAGKVIQGGRPISLEPMPANERRIIHVTLRDHNQVYTESSGEGRRRQVRIFPKRM